MELVNILKHVELCRGLTDEQLKRLAQISHQESFAADSVIFEQGTAGDKMYVVSKGQVEIQVKDSEGGVYTAVFLGSGQIFGEMALLDEGKRSAAVVAVDDDTVVYSIDGDSFAELCRSDTAIGYVMMRNMAQDLSFKLRHRDFDPSSSL